MDKKEEQMYGLGFVILLLCGSTIAFLALNGELTGFAIANTSSPATASPHNSPPSQDNSTVQAASSDQMLASDTQPISVEDLTIEDAQNAMWEAERIKADLQRRGISVQSFSDAILEADRIIRKANYTLRLEEAIANNNTEAAEALREALALMQGTYAGSTVQHSYAEVLRIINEVKERKDPAYLLYDKLTITRKKIADYKERELNVEKGVELLAEAEQSFKDERFDEGLRYVEEANQELERIRSETPLLRALEESSKGFLQKNWKQLTGLLLVMIIGGFFGWKRIRRIILRNKIEQAATELKSLKRMVEETQKACFTDGSISETTYKIRMDTYRKKQEDLMVALPVLEEKLLRLSKGKEQMRPDIQDEPGRLTGLQVSMPNTNKLPNTDSVLNSNNLSKSKSVLSTKKKTLGKNMQQKKKKEINKK